MSKNLEVALLLDFYGDVLTDKQKEVIELYYNEDLSLSEIGENTGVTRQGVRDAIKRGEALLYEMEERLGFLKQHKVLQTTIQKIVTLSNEILSYNDKYSYSREIEERSKEIIRLANGLKQE